MLCFTLVDESRRKRNQRWKYILDRKEKYHQRISFVGRKQGKGKGNKCKSQIRLLLPCAWQGISQRGREARPHVPSCRQAWPREPSCGEAADASLRGLNLTVRLPLFVVRSPLLVGPRREVTALCCEVTTPHCEVTASPRP